MQLQHFRVCSGLPTLPEVLSLPLCLDPLPPVRSPGPARWWRSLAVIQRPLEGRRGLLRLDFKRKHHRPQSAGWARSAPFPADHYGLYPNTTACVKRCWPNRDCRPSALATSAVQRRRLRRSCSLSFAFGACGATFCSPPAPPSATTAPAAQIAGMGDRGRSVPGSGFQLPPGGDPHRPVQTRPSPRLLLLSAIPTNPTGHFAWLPSCSWSWLAAATGHAVVVA